MGRCSGRGRVGRVEYGRVGGHGWGRGRVRVRVG